MYYQTNKKNKDYQIKQDKWVHEEDSKEIDEDDEDPPSLPISPSFHHPPPSNIGEENYDDEAIRVGA